MDASRLLRALARDEEGDRPTAKQTRFWAGTPLGQEDIPDATIETRVESQRQREQRVRARRDPSRTHVYVPDLEPCSCPHLPGDHRHCEGCDLVLSVSDPRLRRPNRVTLHVERDDHGAEWLRPDVRALDSYYCYRCWPDTRPLPEE